jgi:hypothetical protein
MIWLGKMTFDEMTLNEITKHEMTIDEMSVNEVTRCYRWIKNDYRLNDYKQ